MDREKQRKRSGGTVVRGTLTVLLLAGLAPIALSLSALSPSAIGFDAFVAAVALRGGVAAVLVAAWLATQFALGRGVAARVSPERVRSARPAPGVPEALPSR